MKKRYYSLAEAEELKGKLVQCNDENCDGSPCGYGHNTPHVYDDSECFCECGHEGCHGICVLLKGVNNEG